MKNTLNTLLAIGLFSPIAIFAAENAALNTVHIRSLAASCAACHGTNGKAAPTAAGAGVSGAVLAGMDKEHISSKLMAFKSGSASATVMHRHAKGLTDDEILALADYFSSQPTGAAPKLNSQKLRADHAH